jgi:Fic family protein
MKKTDFSPDRQQFLVPLADYPGAFAFIPPPTPRHIPLPGLGNEVTKAHEALGVLQAATSALPYPNLVTRTFDRREAVRSSQIEGTSSDVNDLLLYEATGGEDGFPKDVVVTLNYVKTLEHGLARVKSEGGVKAFTSDLINELHLHLMDGMRDYNGKPGEFRDRQNWIGGFRRIYDARFVPPPPDQVQSCVEDLVRLLQRTPPEEDQLEIPIVMRMAIVHAQFETIHPFMDGNGRVGRILLPLMLAAEGYPPVYLAGFLKANQQAYYEYLLAVQLKGEWTEWVRFFATGMEVAARESIQTAQELTAILDRWKRELGESNVRADAVVHRLPELLIGTPVVTVGKVVDALGISFPSANNALAHLERMGILEQPGTRRQRKRTFVAKEVVELLNRPPEEYYVY